MFVFVGGTAFTSIISPGRGSERIGDAYGEPIIGNDRDLIGNQTRILDRLGFPWRKPWASSWQDQSLPPLSVIDYLLLIREARASGASPDLIKTRIELSKVQTDLATFRIKNRISLDALEESVANFQMVIERWASARASVRASELETMQGVRDQNETINVSIVAIDAAALVDEETPISTEELQAHLDKYKNKAVGKEARDFGYRIPDQVQVEYIAIDTNMIKPSEEVTVREAEEYWEENRTQFLAPEEDQEQDPPEGENTDEKPLAPQSRKPYETFEEAQEKVMAFLRKEHQLDNAREMSDLLIRRLRDPWYDLSDVEVEEEKKDQPPSVPPGVDQDGYYEKIVEKQKSDLYQPDCISFGKTAMFSGENAQAVEILGKTVEDVGGTVQPLSFFQAAWQIKELADVPVDEQDSGSKDLCSVYQTASNALIDEEKRLYVFRVIKVEKAHAPESLDLVRDQVLADVRLERAMELARGHAQEMKELVTDKSLKEVWEAFAGFDADQKDQIGAWFEAQPFARSGKVFYFSGRSFELPVTIVDKAGGLDNRLQSEDFVSHVFDLLDKSGENAVGVLDVPGLEKCFLVQLAGVNPVSKSQYKLLKKDVQSGITAGRVETLKQEWFSREKIRARAGFVLAS